MQICNLPVKIELKIYCFGFILRIQSEYNSQGKYRKTLSITKVENIHSGY